MMTSVSKRRAKILHERNKPILLSNNGRQYKMTSGSNFDLFVKSIEQDTRKHSKYYAIPEH